MRPVIRAFAIYTLIFLAPLAWAEGTPEVTDEEDPESPWFIVPLISSDPKISTAIGALAGYVRQFDEDSPPSLFGITGTYSTTDSYYYGVFAKTHFLGDNHRFNIAAVQGVIRNDYDDFLGSGLPVQTTDDLTLTPCVIPTRFIAIGTWDLNFCQPITLSPEVTPFPVRSSKLLG